MGHTSIQWNQDKGPGEDASALCIHTEGACKADRSHPKNFVGQEKAACAFVDIEGAFERPHKAIRDGALYNIKHSHIFFIKQKAYNIRPFKTQKIVVVGTIHNTLQSQ